MLQYTPDKEANMSDDIIYRNFVATEEELRHGMEMCYAAQRVVQKVYLLTIA
jgi:hypothetical protein